MSVVIVTQLVTQRGVAPSVSRRQDDHLILSMRTTGAKVVQVRSGKSVGRIDLAEYVVAGPVALWYCPGSRWARNGLAQGSGGRTCHLRGIGDDLR
jgi:hypothetical protein